MIVKNKNAWISTFFVDTKYYKNALLLVFSNRKILFLWDFVHKFPSIISLTQFLVCSFFDVYFQKNENIWTLYTKPLSCIQLFSFNKLNYSKSVWECETSRLQLKILSKEFKIN